MAYPQQRPPRQPPPMRGPSRGPPAGDGNYDYGYDDGYGGYGDGGYGGYGDPYAYGGGGGGGAGGDYGPPPRSRGPPRGPPPRGHPSRPPRGGYGPPPMDYGYGPPPRGYGPPPGGSRRPPPPGRERMKPGPGPRRPPPGRDPYDNPYPPMVPRGGEQRPRKGSIPPPIDRGMAAMDINGPPYGKLPDRPHTSNGRRPGPPPDGYPPGRGPPPASRSATSGRPPRPYDNGYGDPHDPPMMPPSRSATAPMEAMGGFPLPEPPFAGSSNPYRESTHDADLLVDSYYGSAPDDPDMPNFDAMPGGGKTGLIDESLPGLEQPRANPRAAPPEAGGAKYAAFNPQMGTSGAGDVSASNEFASFQFDLPGGDTAGAQQQDDMGYGGYADNPYQRKGSHSHMMPGHSNPNGPPRPYRMNQPGNDLEVGDPQNPDSLPHHPMPFRPGHDGGKPAPVRQYNGATAGGAANGPTSPTSGPAPEVQGPPPVTREEIEQLQLAVKKKPSDQATQLLLAQKLVEAATVLVDAAHLDSKSKAKAREKYVIDGHKIVKKLSSAGYPEAQFYLADCYGQGALGLEVDNKEAYNLYHAAAKSNHPQAAYRVAVCCEIGHEEGGGTKRDPVKAVQWYRRAATLGDTPAMYKMGMIQVKGLLGQTKNPREGVTWLKRAAEKADEENPHALHELALMYSQTSPNDIVLKDEAYAKQFFYQAAELGYKFSQFRLAAAYEYGLMGCPVDPRQSIIWYTHAAAQGEHQSELALSGWYLTGSEGNLQQSDTEAYLWARKAATAGLAKAEYAMGYFTEVGIGVTANLDDAKRWYWRAAGFPKARERLEELKKGGSRMQKRRLSRSAVNRQGGDGDCIVM